MNEITTNDAVRVLEQECLKLPQVQIRTEHALSGGIYTRTIHIPADTVVTGLPHKHDHMNIMTGDITVSTDEGMKRLTGYQVVPAKAGLMRAGYAHADTVWTTIFATDLIDIEAIENEMTDESEKLQTRKTALTATKHNELEV